MRYVILFLFVVTASAGRAQYFRNSNPDFKRVDIPFEYRNNLIIVDLTLNQLFPLKFIFDTGAENTVLANRQITDILNVPYEREFKLLGSDLTTELTAYLVRNMQLKIHDLLLKSHAMLVLEEDYFRFEELIGIQVQGILGADVFRGLVVKIDYNKKVITLTKRHHFDPPGDYDAVPLEIYRSKPYLISELKTQQDTSIQVKLLLDTGAMITFILNINTHPDLNLPPNVLQGNLGAGLGGFLEGYLGRVNSLQLGPHALNNPLTYFQDVSMAIDTSLLNGRNGIIGNQLLNRFTLIIDYPKQMLYLKPNRRFDKSFEFDKSGLVIIAADLQLNSLIVHDVIAGSPAEEAGVLPGDKITHFNGFPVFLFSLEGVGKRLRKKVGKKIKLRVKRGDEKLTLRFKLRKLI